MQNIPKIINYCWFGKNNKSKLIEKCINSWKKYCPDYEIKEWNEENFDINMNKYISEAYKQKKWAFVSDYARLWIIYNYGGIYLDTDVELINHLPNELLEHNGFFCMEGKMIATGLGFGAKKHDKIVKALLDSYNQIKFDSKMTCVILNEPIFSQKFGVISEKKVNNVKDYLILPSEYFCPLNFITKELNITNKTIGIHWYGASWQNKRDKIKYRLKDLIRILIGNKNYEKLKQIKL